jgi:TRAP-type uncharacterized transport system substrate-binding protein
MCIASRNLVGAFLLALASLLVTGSSALGQAQSAMAPPDAVASPPYGIDARRPLFGGACAGCPWGILGIATSQALRPYGYDMQMCWVCYSTFGPRQMADKTKPVLPPSSDTNPAQGDTRPPPPEGILDISATSEANLTDAWNGTGPYAADGKKRQNYRVVAAVQSPLYLLAAVRRDAGITSLAAIKDRAQATWVYADRHNEVTQQVLAHYGLTEELLAAKGGGFLPSNSHRELRGAADVIIHHGNLLNTPEQRVWYEATQLGDLQFMDLDEQLIARMAQRPGYEAATVPAHLLRGIDRRLNTVMRKTHFIYVRDEAPDSFVYTLAKALDEQQHVFHLQAQPFYYEPKLVARTGAIPLHPAAARYYRERGYLP